jgi:DNA polymerase III epsilon subunit-like protein
MYLFFDTETTGIPRNYRAPVADLQNWPRLVQLAWLLVDADGNEVASTEYIARPDGFTIPSDAARIHGITTAIAQERGVDIGTILDAVVPDIGRAAVLIAHNMSFDEKILGAELLRAGRPNVIESGKRQCTMLAATDYCRLPGQYGFKWPTLQELHTKLFNEPFAGAHRALVDVRTCARCYFELRRLKVLG